MERSFNLSSFTPLILSKLPNGSGLSIPTDDMNAAHDGGDRSLAACCHRGKGIIDVLGADSKPNQEVLASCPDEKIPLTQAELPNNPIRIWTTVR